MRFTEKNMHSLLTRLRGVTGNDKLEIDSAYGGHRLIQDPMNGAKEITSGFQTVKELSQTMLGMILGANMYKDINAKDNRSQVVKTVGTWLTDIEYDLSRDWLEGEERSRYQMVRNDLFHSKALIERAVNPNIN